MSFRRCKHYITQKPEVESSNMGKRVLEYEAMDIIREVKSVLV